LSSFIFSEKGYKLLSFFLTIIESSNIKEKAKNKYFYFISSIKKFRGEKLNYYSKICGYLSILKSAVQFPHGKDFIAEYERRK